MSHTIFAVDIGTSSLKAALIDSDGLVLHENRQHFPSSKRLVDHWFSAFLTTYKNAQNVLRSGKKTIDAIVISGNGPSVVSLDRTGTFGPILLWNDPIPSEEPRSLTKTNVTNSQDLITHRSLFISRILALQEKSKSKKETFLTIFSGPEALIYLLTGKAVTILPEPRYEKIYWTQESLTHANIDASLLPEFVLPGSIVGLYDRGIPVIAGGPDFIVALIGTGTLTAGTACDRAGTSEGLNVCTEIYVEHPLIRTLPAIREPLWNASFLLPNSGSTFHQWRNEQGLTSRSYPDILSEIEKSPIHSPTNEHPGRTIVENIGFSLRQGIEILSEKTHLTPSFRVSGGQARNPVWIQMKADMTGSVFEQTNLADAELMGNAILGAVALGDWESLETAVSAMVRIRNVYTPRKDLFEQYTQKYDIWCQNNVIRKT